MPVCMDRVSNMVMVEVVVAGQQLIPRLCCVRTGLRMDPAAMETSVALPMERSRSGGARRSRFVLGGS